MIQIIFGTVQGEFFWDSARGTNGGETEKKYERPIEREKKMRVHSAHGYSAKGLNIVFIKVTVHTV